jgi:multidrug efflux system outer membrane protein
VIPTGYPRWRSQVPAEISLEAWQQLGDTTLSRLVRDVVSANLDVQAARARLSAARAARTRAALDLTPSATVAGGYTRQRLSSATFPNASGTFPDQNVWDAGFDASWELDVFGRLRRNVQGQGALVGAAQEDLRNFQVILTAELARTYFELRGAQEQLQVAEKNAENQRRTLQVTRERLDAGRGTSFDTDRAQAQLSTTLASIPDRQAQVAAAQYRIGVLVGRSPAAVARELTQPARLPSLPAIGDLGSPDSVVRNRPDVALAERRAAAERAFVGAAKADYLPRISVGGGAGFTSSTFDRLGDHGSFRYAVGPVISWPALNLGRVKADVDVARARQDAADAEYSKVVLGALQEVETALSRYRSARARVEQLEEAGAASERAADLARLRFNEGVTDFLQVLDAERTQLEAQDRLALGRTDAATAYAALYQAVGGRAVNGEK